MTRNSFIAAVLIFGLTSCNFYTSVNKPITSQSNYDLGISRYGIEMAYVKGGTFMMGCPLGPERENGCAENEKPAHEVTVSDFYIGKHEVTQKQWREIMGTDISQQRDKCGKGQSSSAEGRDYPMYYVTWYDAVEFCNRLSELTWRNPAYNIDKTGENPNVIDGKLFFHNYNNKC